MVSVKSDAMKKGSENEPFIIEQYLLDQPDEVNYRPVGLVCNPDIPWLGASPDGMCWTANDAWILEAKYVDTPSFLDDVAKARGKSWILKLDPVTNQIVINTSHLYFYQVFLSNLRTNRTNEVSNIL
jgi:hypothetical protein